MPLKYLDIIMAKHKKSNRRRGLRIFVGTANLGHALPDEGSLSAWIPRHGKVNHVLNNDTKSSSIVNESSYTKEKDWNGIDAHGQLEVIAIGMQESVPGSSAGLLTATGLTAKLTGTTVTERNVFSKAWGDLGKPMDGLAKNFNEIIAAGVKGQHAEFGGTKKIQEMVVIM